MEGWSDFLTAQAGAAAGLAGLIFVGLSLNLERLLRFPEMLHRAAVALAMLVAILVTSSLMLVPDQSLRTVGVQAAAVGVVIWIIVTLVSIRIMRGTAPQYRGRGMVLFGLRQLSTLPLIVGGLLLVNGREGGMDWVVAAFILTFIVALVESWVILVEIER